MLRLKNILWIIFGAGLFSFGINYLAIPNHLFEGGVTGVTLITYYLFKLPVSVMNLVINFPLFFFAWKILGKQSFFYSLIGTFSVSAWLAIFEKIPCDVTELVVRALSAKTKATPADSGAAKRRGVNICILFSTVNNNAPQHHFSEYAAVWVVQHL